MLCWRPCALLQDSVPTTGHTLLDYPERKPLTLRNEFVRNVLFKHFLPPRERGAAHHNCPTRMLLRRVQNTPVKALAWYRRDHLCGNRLCRVWAYRRTA